MTSFNTSSSISLFPHDVRKNINRYKISTSIPGSLSFSSLVVEERASTTREKKEREPGIEVDKIFQNNNGMSKCSNTQQCCLGKRQKLSNSKFGLTCMSLRGYHGNVKNVGQTVGISKCLGGMNEELLKILASQSKCYFHGSEKTSRPGDSIHPTFFFVRARVRWGLNKELNEINQKAITYHPYLLCEYRILKKLTLDVRSLQIDKLNIKLISCYLLTDQNYHLVFSCFHS